MWEHVHWLDFHHLVVNIQQLEVTCLCGWVAADIHDAAWCCKEDGVNHILMHAGTWRVGDDDIRTSMRLDELFVEDVLHVSCIEERVGDAVDFRIHLRILDGFWHIFDANDLTRLTSHKIGNRTRSRV